MFARPPQLTETLEWMLQSRQVGDATLIKTLVHEQYEHVYRLVLAIQGAQDCRELTELILCAVVDDSSSFQDEGTIQSWLARQTISVILKAEWQGPRRVIEVAGSDVDGDSERPVRAFTNWYADLSFQARAAITLHFLAGFEPLQIAKLLGECEEKVTGYLKVPQEMIPAIGSDPGNPGGRRSVICDCLVQDWSNGKLDAQTEQCIARRIQDRLGARRRKKLRVVKFTEAILAVLAVILVAGMGDLITKITPQPTPVIVRQTALIHELVYITPTPQPTQPPTPFPESAIVYQATGGETLREVAEKIYFNIEILCALNNLPADQRLESGQEVMIGVSKTRVILPTSAAPGVTPPPTQIPPVALAPDTPVETILQRISNSWQTWDTLWADALIIQHGPVGYLGDPEIRRQQIWIDQPYFYYLLDGENGGQVNYAFSAIGGLHNLFNIQTGEAISNMESHEIDFQADLHQMLVTSGIQSASPEEVEVLGEERLAGREVIVLDWYHRHPSMRGAGFEIQQERIPQARYWVDKQFGVILRYQDFSGSSSGQPFKEAQVSNILFNVSIPQRLYDRSQYLQTYFAKDNTGDFTEQEIEAVDLVLSQSHSTEEIQYLTPPEDFDIKRSQLQVYWTSLNRFDPGQKTAVDIYGDGYYLGNLVFAEPEQLRCARSSDGGWIAFSSGSNEPGKRHTPVGWVNLSQLPQVEFFNPDILPHDFAFSPDSQQLAVYGCWRRGEGACGIYLIDLEDSNWRLLHLVEQGSEMIWRPDGTQIAIQGSFLKNGKWRLLVFDIDSGSVYYDGPFDWDGIWVAHDSPLHEWGIQYPPARGGLELCSQPPPGV